MLSSFVIPSVSGIWLNAAIDMNVNVRDPFAEHVAHRTATHDVLVEVEVGLSIYTGTSRK